MSFNIKQTKKIKYNDGSRTVRFTIYKNNLKPMTPDEIKTISAMLLKRTKIGTDFLIKGHSDKLKPDDPVSIQALNPANWRTIKAYGQGVSYMDEEDYYNGKVRDKSKFDEYYQASITINFPPE
jgi:hypothetical protein